jgi:DNA mismatch repair protein MutL
MSKIKILPEILSNKIAAGEVVERPASVVKELIENALDANSTRIIIEIEKGGRSLIRVSDNGTGMNRDDAMLAMERYATSKIFKDTDLFEINTLGFRGEALPSIASVSRFSLVTRDEDSQAGTEIIVEGGKVKKVSEVGAPPGTMVTVKQLFFNTPARRKFLKTVSTEMGHIADIVSSIALGRPDVRFKLIHNGNVVKNLSAANNPVDRVSDVLGQDLTNNLHRIEPYDSHVSIAGWTSTPRVTRSTSRGIYVYVNGRFVRDRVIQHALFEGYGGRLMKGQFPMAALFINLPFDQVDVNVHPTKNEVRFAQQKKVHEAVKMAVAGVLDLVDRPEWTTARLPDTEPVGEKPRISEPVFDYGRPQKVTPIQRPTTSTRRQTSSIQAPLWEKKRFGDLRVMGQLQNTYILCESADGLVLIDQHAAHERILFEKLKDRSSTESKSAQKLLIPETIDLGYRETDILTKLIPDLKELGLAIEPFGGNTFVVKAVPALLANREVKPLVIEIVEKVAEIGFTPGLEKAIDQCLLLMACHGAIRANQHLSDRQIKELLVQLDKCDNPSHCPHGRPTWISWTTRSLEKSFSRIV